MKKILISLLLLSGCALLGDRRGPVFDVRKTCSEYPRLVLEIVPFRENHFEIIGEKGGLQSWELHKNVAKSYGLDFLQLQFDKDKLRSVQMGPRTNLEDDLKKIGMIPYDLTNAKGKHLDVYDLTRYHSKDFDGKKMEITYGHQNEPGFTIRCFQ